MKDDLDIAVAAMYKGCKTYKDWRRVGRQVREGEKCVGWVNGKAVFRKEQTDDVVYRYRSTRCRPTTSEDKPSFSKWCEQQSDNGRRVSDRYGREIGTRSYIEHQGEYIAQTCLDSGGTLTHFGGPCGSLYTDEFGNA